MQSVGQVGGDKFFSPEQMHKDGINWALELSYIVIEDFSQE